MYFCLRILSDNFNRNKDSTFNMKVLYEDNHLIIVNKAPSEIVQGDKTGDKPLSEMMKDYLRDKYNKPGNVFCGVVHRLDRPTSGVIVFAKTSKALTRLNKMFKDDDVEKVYWAIVQNRPRKEKETLTHYLIKNQKANKSSAYDIEKPNTKKGILHYSLIAQSDNYFLLEVNLETGRHHQIRVQLSKIGSPIKGDLKYGAKRSNRDGSISLHARSISFIHPVSQKKIDIVAPVPDDSLWKAFEKIRK